MLSISCRCTTYGRVDTLEESLYSFLSQKYDGPKELIILNDYPLQKLHFDHPEVKIFNLDYTVNTIGEKENMSVELCSYDTIAIWDDDDIALSNHLFNINQYFISDVDLLFWKNAIYFNSGSITSLTAVGHSGFVYSRKIWQEVGGYPKANAGCDTLFIQEARKKTKNIINAYPPNDSVSWIYYWGNRSYHMSGLGVDKPDRPNIIQRHSKHIEALRKQGKIPTGDIELKPKWKLPYDKLHKEYLLKMETL
jgi:hypothetical protein